MYYLRSAVRAALLTGLAVATVGCAHEARLENRRIAQYEPSAGYGGSLPPWSTGPRSVSSSTA
jgi:hypothetical protein